MLAKLFKYEWKSVSLLLLIMHAGLLVYSLIGRIGYQFFLSGNTGSADEGLLGMGIVFYLLIYILGIMAVALMTILYLAMRIQKSLFSDEGYLTNTLPVSPVQLLLSKSFILWVWVIIDAFAVMVSVAILLVNGDSWPYISRGFSEVWDSLVSMTGFSGVLNSIIYFFTLLTQFFCYDTGMLIFSICLGSLFKTHKIMGTVMSFFGIIILSNIIQMVISGVMLPGGINSWIMVNSSEGQTGNYFYLLSIAWYIIAGVALFFGSKFILSKKLNLD